MNVLRKISPALALPMLAITLSATPGYAQTAPVVLDDQVIRLGEAFPDNAAAKKHEFHSRKIELAPGARTDLVNHAGRPSITYVIKGVATEHRVGAAEPLTHNVGAATMDRSSISHYWENRGQEPVVLLVVEVAPLGAK